MGEFAFEKGNPLHWADDGAARRRLCCTAVKRREKEKAALYLSIHSGGQICSSAGHSMFGSQIGLRNLEGTKIYIVETHAFLERTVNIGSEALSWKMKRQFYRRGIFVSKVSCWPCMAPA